MLVLLSLSVVLTIVLFVMSRSITDIAISTEQADSVRAFSAAEAGVENALITGAGSGGSVQIGDASYSVDVTNYSQDLPNFNYPIPLLSGDTMTNWFVSHDSTGQITCAAGFPCFTGNTLKVCWGNSGTPASNSTTPAIEISVYYETAPGNLSTIQIGRATFDPNVSRAASNYFAGVDAGTCQIDGVGYSFQKTITMSGLGIPAGSYNTVNGLLFAKVRMLYNTDTGHIVGTSANFAGDTTLPSQGINIVSTGVSGTTGSLSNRRVSVFRGWQEFPLSGLSVFYPYGVNK
ncbi:MAG: hypothetical protein UU74_C0044G0009 [Candidatus Woesebacteria bacterium GW2011_GWA1_41_7]|uniref:Type 4 fimbrial biogenesis protein PilX N-terminal domain-containing protein n=1 Tax=Candidatus Woesebacteria bacterium GW2011_GWA1_41_7 TaxID=1618556 RepID=A0A0G0ZTM5_9BACT|nr:MAG: hypothetical protein UU74_C0044G0009 [Candidatus Woesebacteria bacterium GW2011_GWA1_41_7]